MSLESDSYVIQFVVHETSINTSSVLSTELGSWAA